MTNSARIGKFYFEALDEFLDDLDVQLADLYDEEFPSPITDDKIFALRTLYTDLNKFAQKQFNQNAAVHKLD